MKLKCKGSFSCRGILILAAVISILLTGCKVSYSFTGASTEGLSTLSIKYFQNRASIVQPELSQGLTNALIDKCKSQTSLTIINDIGDVNFEGEISDYNTRPLTVGADASAAMNRFTITVKVKYTNIIDPDKSFEQSFSRYQDYRSTFDLGDVEDELVKVIIEMIVEDIFNMAFVNW